MGHYVLWAETGKEDYVRDLLEKAFKKRHSEVVNHLYVPKKPYYRHNSPEEKQRSGEEYTLLYKVLFPGYLFVETDDIRAFYLALQDFVTYTFYILLGRRDSNFQNVSERELAWIDRLANMTPSTAVISEGKLSFVSGSLMGMEEYVTKVHLRNRCVCLALPFFGETRQIWIAVDFQPVATKEQEEGQDSGKDEEQNSAEEEKQ